MKVIIDEEAQGDLDRIYVWIAKDNPRDADEVIEHVLEMFEILDRFPHMGHPGRSRATFEWAIARLPYIIVYELKADRDQLIVTGVFHGAQKNRRTNQ